MSQHSDATTKKCTVVDSKPTTTSTTVVGDGVYKTKVEAESAVKTTKVCTEQQDFGPADAGPRRLLVASRASA